MSEANPAARPRQRRFRREIVRLWLGQLLSAVGDRLHEIALVWIAVDAVGEHAGWVIAAGSAARLLCGLPGGVYADRWHRQRVMIACDLLRAAAVSLLIVWPLGDPNTVFVLAAVAVFPARAI